MSTVYDPLKTDGLKTTEKKKKRGEKNAVVRAADVPLSKVPLYSRELRLVASGGFQFPGAAEDRFPAVLFLARRQRAAYTPPPPLTVVVVVAVSRQRCRSVTPKNRAAVPADGSSRVSPRVYGYTCRTGVRRAR